MKDSMPLQRKGTLTLRENNRLPWYFYYIVYEYKYKIEQYVMFAWGKKQGDDQGCDKFLSYVMWRERHENE